MLGQPPALAPPLDVGPRGSLVGDKLSPVPLYTGPLGGELDMGGLRELLGRALLSSPPHAPPTSPLSLSLSCGSSKGCVEARATPPLHDKVQREFRIGSKPIYFRNLDWIRDPEGVIVHHMCTSTTRCCTCNTKLLHRCCHTGIVALRSSWPWGRLRCLYRQCLCRSVIPVFDLRGYITESPLIIIALLLDRSWAIQGCIGNNFLFLPNPNSGTRARSMRSMLVWLEHIAICGRWSSRCYPPMCIFLYLWHSWIEAAWRPTLHISRETGSTTDIRLAPYKSGLSGVCFSNYSGYGVCNGGPLTGNQRNNSLINVVVSCS
jgi:hypothetical protein